MSSRRAALFNKSASEALTLTVLDEEYTFNSPRELEFALAGRACLPSSKLASMVELSEDALLREVEAIRAVEQLFADALSGSLENVTSISPFLKEMDLSLISQDHEWRAIVTALNQLSRPFEEYKKVALVKYMQYLNARQEIVKTIYSIRRAMQSKAERPADGNGAGAKLKETVIFDISALGEPPSKAALEYSRLPKGETVEILFEPNQIVDLLIAKHRCSIALRERLVFVDDQGRDSILRAGKSIVGRDATSDIVVNPSFRDVSRKHLIVETDGQSTVRLTDISSHGTSVPPEYLETTSI